MGSDDDEVKRENAQPDPVSTPAGWVSLMFLTVDLVYYGGQRTYQRFSIGALMIGMMSGLGLFRLKFALLWEMNSQRLV